MFISRKNIQDAKKTVGEPLFVPVWDGYINIRRWSGTQRANLISEISEVYDLKKDDAADITPETPETIAKKVKMEDLPKMFVFMTKVAMISLCDEDGVLLYDSSNPDDVTEASDIDGDTIQMLFNECAKRNGLLEKDLKQEIKNLDTTQKSDSI